MASGSDITDRSITFALGTSGTDRGVRVDIDLGLVGPLMAVLAVEAVKLNEGLPESERTQSATLSAKAVWLSQDQEGHPMIVFELVNGSLLPLAMLDLDFAGLAAEMALLAGKPSGPMN